ncbi:hypothetical protein [Saccharopolyspora sp. NPDC002376]
MHQKFDIAGLPVAIGVVGPPDIVEGMLATGSSHLDGLAGVRLIGAAYESEDDVGPQVKQIADAADALLFVGQWPMDLARHAVDIPIPCTAVPLSGSSLLAVLLRAQRREGVDITRISIDSLPRKEVRQALADAGMPAKNVMIKEYRSPQTVSTFLDWHVSAYKKGRTTAAFTTIGSVARGLQEQQVPVFRVLPSAASIRTATSSAALMAVWQRAARTRTAFMLLRISGATRIDREVTETVRLALHLALVEAATTLRGVVLPRWDGVSFALLTTAEDFAHASEYFSRAPLVDAIRHEVGVDLHVGVGFGTTVAEAQACAEQGLQVLTDRGTVRGAAIVDTDGGTVLLEQGASSVVAARPAVDETFGTLVRAVAAQQGDGGGKLVVHSEQVADILGINIRTARRLLANYVRQGVAWPVPSGTQTGRGRPRRMYRLLDEPTR